MFVFMRNHMVLLFLGHPGGQVDHRMEKSQQKGCFQRCRFVNRRPSFRFSHKNYGLGRSFLQAQKSIQCSRQYYEHSQQPQSEKHSHQQSVRRDAASSGRSCHPAYGTVRRKAVDYGGICLKTGGNHPFIGYCILPDWNKAEGRFQAKGTQKSYKHQDPERIKIPRRHFFQQGSQKQDHNARAGSGQGHVQYFRKNMQQAFHIFFSLLMNRFVHPTCLRHLSDASAPPLPVGSASYP